MKLKLKLILASMFFCSVIFAQGNSPGVQFRMDRAQNVTKVNTVKKSEKQTLKQSNLNKLTVSKQTTLVKNENAPNNRSAQQVKTKKEVTKINFNVKPTEQASPEALYRSVAHPTARTTKPRNFNGANFDTSLLLEDQNGQYFNADNTLIKTDNVDLLKAKYTSVSGIRDVIKEDSTIKFYLDNNLNMNDIARLHHVHFSKF